MALDRQRILGELGSVMKQIQSADCGCLGKIFGGSPQPASSMGNPLPTCGGCRRSCCHGHGYGNYNGPECMNQPAQNMSTMPAEATNPCQQPMSGNMFGFGPQIVHMMRGDHKAQNMPVQGPGQLTGPMVIDAPQSPHGKVGITPVTPSSVMQQQQNPVFMNQGVTGPIPQQFIPQQSYGAESVPPSQQQINPNMTSMTPWHQRNNANTGAQFMPTKTNPHVQHSQGIAKFNEMFPGVKNGLGGDLGFDPMAIAIQMNPDNHLQSAMDTMGKIMNDNKDMNKIMNPIGQPAVGANLNIPQNSQVSNQAIHQNLISNQMPLENMNHTGIQSFNLASSNQLANQLNPVQETHNKLISYKINPEQSSISNTYGQVLPAQNQQIYATANLPKVNRTIDENGESHQLNVQQPYGQQKMAAPNLPVTYEEVTDDNQMQSMRIQPIAYANDSQPQEMIKEPIFPADTSRNIVYSPSLQRNNYGYNTLGQPVEMLPAKMFHPPELSLPQTLSPQAPIKPRANPLRAVNVKATLSKTSLMGNKPVGRSPSRNQLQHIYNQYKGSHSFTQQNVRDPCEGTYSDGRLNISLPNAKKAQPVPVERVGGDTVVNNQPSEQIRTNKVNQVMRQTGDVAAAKPGGDTLPLKEAPMPMKKTRNGLQDMVFSSYPTSTAWTFHGHGCRDSSPTRRLNSRRY